MLIIPFEHQTLICVIRKLTKINLSSLQARRSAIYKYQFEFVWDPFLLLIEIVESFLNQYVC